MSDARVQRLEGLCSELYQIVGEIMFANRDLSNAFLPILDALAAAQMGGAIPEADLLPWHLPDWAYDALKAAKP